MTVSFIENKSEEINGKKVCIYGENLKIKSSMINAMSYHPHTAILTLTFNNDETYYYFKVPKDIYLQLASAKSLGSAFHVLIKDKFKFKKIRE